MSESFEIRPFEQCIDKVKYTTKIASQDFKESGRYPIISQEEAFISGYWDLPEDVFHISKPIVVFGDHSRHLKYIDFDFVIGADGVKILSPVDDINAKYLYYYLRWLDIPSLGYSRHFKALKEKTVKVFPLDVQQRIVSELDLLTGIIDKKNDQLRDLDALALAVYHEMFDGHEEWQKGTIKDVYSFQYGKGNNIPEDKGNYPCYGSNGIVGHHIAYNSENAPVIGHIGAYAGIVNWASGKHYVTYNGVICKINEGYDPIYGLYLLKAQDYLNAARRGGAQPFVSYDMLYEPCIFIPPYHLQNVFANRVAVIDKEKKAISSSLIDLNQLLSSRMDHYFND